MPVPLRSTHPVADAGAVPTESMNASVSGQRRTTRIPSTDPTPPPADTDACLCVLASGSRGNCTILLVGRGNDRYAILLDCGLSPRHTYAALKAIGLGPSRIGAVVLTHLDQDHFKSAWVRSMPRHVPVYVHRTHRGRAQRQGLFTPSTLLFDQPFELAGGRLGVRVEPTLLAHDQFGVAAFKLTLANGATLGFATDLGRATQQLITHLRGVDVLAIESNYCPDLQAASPRPAFLKERITGGAGHLSNQEAAELTKTIAPRAHTVLLHLSQECNTPQLAMQGHANSSYALTVSCQYTPTAWIPVTPLSPRQGEQPPVTAANLNQQPLAHHPKATLSNAQASLSQARLRQAMSGGQQMLFGTSP